MARKAFKVSESMFKSLEIWSPKRLHKLAQCLDSIAKIRPRMCQKV